MTDKEKQEKAQERFFTADFMEISPPKKPDQEGDEKSKENARIYGIKKSGNSKA